MLIELLIIAFVCNGLAIATIQGMVFYRPYVWIEKKLPKWIFKPLIGCVNCMASIWGTAIHFALGGSLIQWPIVILSAIFVNGLFAELFNKLQR